MIGQGGPDSTPDPEALLTAAPDVIFAALADAYFMGTVIYPEAFQDVDAVGKARDICRLLLGSDVYDRMAADFGGFTKLELTGR